MLFLLRAHSLLLSDWCTIMLLELSLVLDVFFGQSCSLFPCCTVAYVPSTRVPNMHMHHDDGEGQGMRKLAPPLSCGNPRTPCSRKVARWSMLSAVRRRARESGTAAVSVYRPD